MAEWWNVRRCASADGAYDNERVYKAMENHTEDRSPRVLIPPKKNALVLQSFLAPSVRNSRHVPCCSAGQQEQADSGELVALLFDLPERQTTNVWIDDLEFFTAASAAAPVSCSAPCPLEAVPYPDSIAPNESYLQLSDEFTLHTPTFPNTGSWRQSFYEDGQVEDVEYLELLLDDLEARRAISGQSNVYLAGFSNGGGMVLKAAKERPTMFRGIATIMPFDGWDPAPIPDPDGTGLDRVIFGYTAGEPRLPSGYHEVLAPLPAEWAAALGLPEDSIENPTATELANLVYEGEDYSGSSTTALTTRNSSVTQLDMSSPEVQGRVRILDFDHADHLWPTPDPEPIAWLDEAYGFHNQDVDASDAIWDYFMSEP